MAITLSDVLWYWDHRRGEVPTIGGTPVFSRAGSAYERGPNGIYVPRGVNTPRIEPEGMQLELSQANLLGNPFKLDGTSPWTMQGSYTVSAVGSIYSDRSAYKWPNPGDTTSRVTYQSIGTLTGSPETLSVDVENVNADKTSIGIYDTTALNWVVRLSFDWPTRTATVVDSGAGTATFVRAIKLMDVGPSGGPVYRLVAGGTPANPGNTRRVYIYPSGTAINTQTAILHAAQHVEAGFSTTMVEGTRSADSFYWENPPPPQAFVWYASWRHYSGVTGSSARVAEMGGGNDRLLLWNNSSDAVLNSQLRTAGNAISIGSGVLMDVGSHMEAVIVLRADGTHRLIVSKDGVLSFGGEGAAPTGGLPAAWELQRFSLNQEGYTGTKAATKHATHKIVKLASLTAATDGTADQAVMDEMRGLYVSPDGLRISNAIA